ncbi:MAG TPA: quinohemoprotein amine dehydrogenase subunit alpha [Bryobacteraceae bacterium]
MDAAVSGHSVTAHQHPLHSPRIPKGGGFRRVAPIFLLPGLLLSQAANKALREEGIPVTDPLVMAKCRACHARDERGNMERISWERTTPEGWQEALKKMVLEKRVELTPVEARSIVKSLSATHGLAPEEAKPVMYYPERRVWDESSIGAEQPLGACTECHAAARPLSWRRSAEDWTKLADSHVTQYKVKGSDAAIAFLSRTAPLHTADWVKWSARGSPPNPAGRWLATAHLQGRGKYVGEMQVDPGVAPDEFATRVTLHSVEDGSTIVRTGQALLFGGYAWRGRSKGAGSSSSPGDPLSEAREALWLSPDQTFAEGRWFWGQYQEFGFDVELRRPSPGSTLIALDWQSLKVGSRANSIRLIGDRLPAQVTPKDVNLGPDVTVRRIVSQSAGEVIAEVDVANTAAPGKRDVTLQGSVLKGAIAIYDRVDYIKVTPESSMAAFGNQKYARGFQQFEAVAYQRGPDGRPHTADDLELGPVKASWSMEVFYAVDSSHNDEIGKIGPGGLLAPAAENPGANHDIWVIATALNETGSDGKPLAAKGYVVVTIPEYTFNGRHYVRDLNRWIEEGTW